MSLNCLNCQSLQRTNSEKECGDGGPIRRICCIQVERSWSVASLTPPAYEQMRNGARIVAAKKMRKSRWLRNSTGAVAFEASTKPKLIRSVGMRRDWSFEDLRHRNENRNAGRLVS